MKSETEFVREEAGKKIYGLNQLQPSVGDSGAPVFTFKGKVLHVCDLIKVIIKQFSVIFFNFMNNRRSQRLY